MKGSRVGPSGIRVAILVLLMGTLATSLPVAADETLVARLPLALEGDIAAHAEDGLVRLAADATGTAPRVDLTLTATYGNVVVTNWSRESTAAHQLEPLADKTLDEGSAPSYRADGLEVRIDDLGTDFLLIAHDGGLPGAAYRATPETRYAGLDVLENDQAISYTAEPAGLDHAQDVQAGTFLMAAADARYEISGDFQLIFFDTTVTVLSEHGTNVHRTGTYNEHTSAPDGSSMRSKTTTQFVRIDVYDGVMHLGASGADHALYGLTEKLRIDVDGALATESAAGSLRVGDDHIRGTGERARATGTFTLVPTYIVDLDDREVVFEMHGGFETLATGASAYVSVPGLAALTGFALLAALAAMYFAPTAKMALWVPMYAKLTKDKVLDQDTRSLVHEKIRNDPGCQVNQVAEALDVSWTTAAYHIRVLRKMGLVIAKQKGRHAYLFVSGSREAASHDLVALLKNDTARDIYALVQRSPGIIQKEICAELDIAPSTASWHLTKLRQNEAVQEVRDWKMRRYFLHPTRSNQGLLEGTGALVPEGIAASS